MTLTALHIGNFKAFAAAQKLPLRPITLIFGANSAGKSSLLHALALTHNAVETGYLDAQRTKIGGETIDLGGFRQYVHRRERGQQVELAFELDPGRLSGRVAELLSSARKAIVAMAIGEGPSVDRKNLSKHRERELDRETSVRVERFALEVDGRQLLSMSARIGGLLRLDRLDHSHPIFRELLRGVLLLGTTTQEIRDDDFVALGRVIDRLVPDISARNQSFFPRIDQESENSRAQAKAREDLVLVSRGDRQNDLATAARLFVPNALRELVGGLGSALEEEIRRLRYLGPLRSYPPRHLAFSQDHDPNWFAGGGYAWDVVRRRETVRQQVNSWLGDPDRLQTPYELEVRDLLPSSLVALGLQSKLEDQFHDLLVSIIARNAEVDQPDIQQLAAELEASLEEASSVTNESYLALEDLGPFSQIKDLVAAVTDTDDLSERWAQEMIKSHSEVLQDLVLIDKRTSTPVSHRDVGIGVSQVLPVLVSAYAYSNKLLAIEQPEIHLHPALQAELGDVFIESALGDNGNTFLVETHSEHLILRILRRIRETTDGELPQGIPAIRPEQIAVLYVQPSHDGVEVLNIPATADGEFERTWPEGFFAERAKELF